MAKLVPGSFLKNQNWTYLEIKSKDFYSFFLLYVKLRTIPIYWNEAADHLHLLHIKLYWKTKKSGTSLPASFSEWLIFKKNFLVLCSITRPSFIIGLPFLLEILRNMWIVIVCQPGCDAIFFENNLIFLIKPCSLILSSLYSKDLLKYKNCVIKAWFQKAFEIKTSIIKKIFICKETLELLQK